MDKRITKDMRLKIGIININTLLGKEEEIVTLMKERKLKVLGLCETRREGNGADYLKTNLMAWQ
jgi:hypothetical protein